MSASLKPKHRLTGLAQTSFPLLLLILSNNPAQAADHAQACLEQANRQPAGLSTNLERQCPALHAELQAQGLLASLEPPLSAELSLAQLRFLTGQLVQPRQAAPLNRDGLEQMLAGILQDDDSGRIDRWWQALMKWLDSLKTEQHEGQYQWLLRLLQGLNAALPLLSAAFYLALGLGALYALWQAGRLLYLSGYLPALRRATPAADTPTPSFPAKAREPAADLPPARQIALWLAQADAALAALGIMDNAASLTHRQKLRSLGRQAAAGPYSRLLAAAEPVLYGRQIPDRQLLDACRREAQRLLQAAP